MVFCLTLTVLAALVGLRSVIVTFPGHFHTYFIYKDAADIWPVMQMAWVRSPAGEKMDYYSRGLSSVAGFT